MLFYDISIYLRYSLIYVSEGLCISPIDQCTIESVGTNSRLVQLVTDNSFNNSGSAVDICNRYLTGALNATAQLNMTFEQQLPFHMNISCLHDTILTNDVTVS